MKNILLLWFTCLGILSAQSIIMKPFETKMVEGTDEHLKNYNLLQLDVNTLTKMLDGIPGNVKEFTLRTTTNSFQVQLFEYNLLSPDYIRYGGSLGHVKKFPKRTDFRTFKGILKGQGSTTVSMSVADGFFKIMIDDNKDIYFIEPLDLGSLSPGIPANQQFMMYKTADVIPHEGIKCGADLFHKKMQETEVQVNTINARLKSCKVCAELKICLAADFPMYRKYGGNVMATENQMLTILADVQTVYDDEFENEFLFSVTGTFVVESQATDPWNGMNDINAMLNRFLAVGPSMFFASQYHVATLWTTKFGPTQEVGTAFQSSVCMDEKYNVCSDYWGPGGRQGDYLTLQAHMMGHNFSMIHDPSFSDRIMKPGLPNGSRAWSFLSVQFLNDFVKTYTLIPRCLAICPNSSAPIPEFSADVTYGCQPLTVRFKDLSQNTTMWKWRFPGGTPDSSVLKDPVVIYKVAGIYPVTLEASNHRCDSVLTKTSYIEVNDKPIADFSFGIQGREIFFINQSIRGVEYVWSFGDGEQSEEINPFHEFPTDSTYEITLTATNDCGSHTIKRKIVVESVPTAEFSSDTTAGCAPKIIKFIDQSTRNVKIWNWEFPGGVPSFSTAKNPSVRYDLPGTYDVKLTVLSSRFSHSLTKKIYITIDSVPIAAFTNSVDVGKVDFQNQSRHAKAHLWIFGDNNTSSEANPTHNYTEGTYKVLYIAINSCGQDTAETTLVIGTKPVAAFQSNTVKGCIPYKVQFQNNSVSATSYRWYFPGGNPATSTDPNPLVTYNTEGKYNVSLYAANVFYSDSIGKSDYIEARTLPNGEFTNTISGFKSTFINNTTGATNYLWDFGNGKVSFVKDPVHDYGVEGEFNVRLISQNECGIDTFRKRIAIYLVPKVNFNADTIIGCAPFKVQFREQSSVDVIEWNWQFENGEPATSNERNPCVVFDKIGKYAVKLTVKNTNGTNALTKPQYIQVVSNVFCPEYTKTRKFVRSEDPFGINSEDRSRTLSSNYPVIYPNPANDHIYIMTDASFSIKDIELFDLSGRKLSEYRSSDSNIHISTENLKSGTYYLKINDGHNPVIRKFIISN